MNDILILTHFSEPRWPIVNKLLAICECLDIKMLHCASEDKIRAALAGRRPERTLFFTDETMIVKLESAVRTAASPLEVAVFLLSPIATAARGISQIGAIKYLIGVDPAEAGRDLSILLKKFAAEDILDLEKYLSFGAKINSRTVDSTEAKRDAVEAVAHYIRRFGSPAYNHPYEEYARKVSELTDELLLNAVFESNPRLQGSDRSATFKLEPSEEIRVSWGYDGEYFGVSVRDPFGRFTPESILNCLALQKNMDHGADSGASLGLKLIFDKAHQVIANVRREKMTEVIALVRLASRMAEFERQSKSFYFFSEKKPA